MKKFIIIFLLISNTVFAEKIEQLSWFNLQELLEDDNLTYKIIKSCVSLNSELLVKNILNWEKNFLKLQIICIHLVFSLYQK